MGKLWGLPPSHFQPFFPFQPGLGRLGEGEDDEGGGRMVKGGALGEGGGANAQEGAEHVGSCLHQPGPGSFNPAAGEEGGSHGPATP